MRAFLSKLLQRAQTRASTLGESLDRSASDEARADADAALARWKRALAEDPDDVEANIELGTRLVERGEHAEAEPRLRRAIALAPRLPRIGSVHRALGIALGGLGDRAGAIEHFGHALERDSGDAVVYRDLCLLLAQSGDATRAADIARRGIEAFPDDGELHAFLGNLLAMSGDFAGAEQRYHRAVQIGPPTAETHYNLGIVLRKLGRDDEAIANYRRAVALDASHAAARLNLANALQSSGQLGEALVHYSSASRIAPHFVDAHIGEGMARQMAGEPARALASFERALALAPSEASVHVAMGSALQDLGRLDDAIARFEEGLRHRPADTDTLLHLGNALLKRGDTAAAVARYREVLARDPGNGVAHLVAALTGGEAERASDTYVAKLFDDYADKFDSHLVKELRYETPRLIARLLEGRVPSDGAPWDLLDLGCGTGLVGVAMAPFAPRIVGVDLSPGMLAKARATGHYARLEASELVAMMSGEAASSYDVVTASDVFVYVGKLDDVIRESARLLRPGGLVAFSVESLDATSDASSTEAVARGYRLNENGRYAHTSDYLRRLAERHAFDVVELRDVTLRLEKGTPVAGHVVLWRRSGAAA